MHVSKVPAAAGRDSTTFTSMRDILDGKLQQWSFVDLIGVVVDSQAPVPTRKTGMVPLIAHRWHRRRVKTSC